MDSSSSISSCSKAFIAHSPCLTDLVNFYGPLLLLLQYRFFLLFSISFVRRCHIFNYIPTLASGIHYDRRASAAASPPLVSLLVCWLNLAAAAAEEVINHVFWPETGVGPGGESKQPPLHQTTCKQAPVFESCKLRDTKLLSCSDFHLEKQSRFVIMRTV